MITAATGFIVMAVSALLLFTQGIPIMAPYGITGFDIIVTGSYIIASLSVICLILRIFGVGTVTLVLRMRHIFFLCSIVVGYQGAFGLDIVGFLLVFNNWHAMVITVMLGYLLILAGFGLLRFLVIAAALYVYYAGFLGVAFYPFNYLLVVGAMLVLAGYLRCLDHTMAHYVEGSWCSWWCMAA